LAPFTRISRADIWPLGIVVAGSTPDALAARNAADVARWAPIIKEANIKGE